MFSTVVLKPNNLPPTSAPEESQPRANQYAAQYINYMDYTATVNNNHNPSINHDGLNFPQSTDSSSRSSGNFPENEPHSHGTPTQVAETVQPASEEGPTRPPTQVANELPSSPTSLQS